MLKENRRLIEAGGAIVVLHKGSKRPVANNWSKLERWSWDEAQKLFPEESANIGIRLGGPSRINRLYLFGIDLDITSTEPRHIDEALAALRKHIPEFASLGRVVSGSGGHSRHFYGLTDEEPRTRTVEESTEFVPSRFGDKPKKAWELVVGGTGRQFVLPPSIHPDTGEPYRWAVGEPEWEDLPVYTGAQIRSWTKSDARKVDRSGDSLATWFARQPKDDFHIEDLRTLIDRVMRIPPAFEIYCNSYEGWLSLGMMLHHQTKGSDEGLELYDWFSSHGNNYYAEAVDEKWRSFGKTEASNKPLTIASLIYRLNRIESAWLSGVYSTKAEEEERLPSDFLPSHMPERPLPEQPLIADQDPGDNPFPFHDRWKEDTDGEDEDPKKVPFRDRRYQGLPEVLRRQRKAEIKAAEGWETEFETTLGGVAKPTLHNVGLILANDPRLHGLIRHNAFQNKTVRWKPLKLKMPNVPYRPVKDKVNGDDWTDVDTTSLRFFLNAPRGVSKDPERWGWGMKIAKADVKDVVENIASRNTFHPITNYLKRLQWDGKPRMLQVFSKHFGTPDDGYHQDVARLLFVGAVARVFEPGHKFDFAIILEGEEGVRKTSWIEALAAHPDWYSRLHADFNNPKNMVDIMFGKWILELGELSGFSKATVENIKSFMSDPKDRVRLSYAHNAGTFQRQCIFIGSTNDQRYLQSETGNRRFLPVRVERVIDVEAFIAERNQIWAEAYETYRELRMAKPHARYLPLFLSDAAVAEQAKAMQEDRKIESNVDLNMIALALWLDQKRTIHDIIKTDRKPNDATGKFSDDAADFVLVKVSAFMILDECPYFERRKGTVPNETLAISQAMKKLGWVQNKNLLLPGHTKSQRGYQRPTATAEELRTNYMRADRLNTRKDDRNDRDDVQ